jgi:cholesterol transport system auxiliary component
VRRNQFAVGVILFVTLAGCISLKGREPGTLHTFALERLGATPSATVRHEVRLASMRAAGGFDTDRIAYRRRPFELEYYARHAWVAPPAQMVGLRFAEALAETGVRAVTAAGATGVRVRVEAELTELFQDFTRTPSQTRVGLRVQVLDGRTGTLIAERTFSADSPAPSEDAYGGVAAANRAVADVSREAARFVNTALEAGPAP